MNLQLNKIKSLPKLSDYIESKKSNSEQLFIETLSDIYNYTNFITQPLNLSNFVPSIEKDGKWIVLEEPCSKCSDNCNFDKCLEYQTALDNVVFKGVEVRIHNDFFSVSKDGKTLFDVFGNKTIESIIKYNIEVNENIIKKFNL